MLPKVLVVDDIPDNVKLLTLDLSDAGYDVLTASNGKEALRVILEEGPSIVLTDWMMPEMDRVELCRRIRSLEGIGFVYTIVLTAHTNTDRLVEAFDAGADDFLSKPFHEQELMARLGAGVRIVWLEAELATERRSLHKANAKLEVLNDRLETIATTDELTGLWNRREAMQHLEEQWSVSQRHGQPLSCIMFDIDHFKRVNDSYGHDAGDAVLRGVADTVRNAGRVGERPYRIGGEEFLVICPIATAQEVAAGAERIRAAIGACSVSHNGLEHQVTVSLGVAQRTEGMETFAELLRRVDQALYESKHNGRNRVTVADQTSLKEIPESPTS